MNTVAAICVVLAMVVSPRALAHAFLDHSMPAVGSQVRGSPPSVSLWFTEELEPAFSTIKVFDAQGKQMDAGDTVADPKDRTTLKVSVRRLTPGAYRVVWRVLSLDTHVTEGSFAFTVVP
jgi:methionine-rich copper-binding protein CopC